MLRYIDDFLLVTREYDVARRFVARMSAGFPAYGARISPGKTLTNFELDGALAVAGLDADGRCRFPYCGFRLDTATLDFSIDTERLLAGGEHTRRWISFGSDMAANDRHATELRAAQRAAARSRLRRVVLAPAREPQPRRLRELGA